MEPRHKLRIVLGNADLPNETKGGVAHQTHYLANIFAERGHEVTMVTLSPSFEECRYAVRTLSKPKVPRFANPFAYALALSKFDFSPYDIAHFMGDNYLIRANRSLPIMRTMHGSAKDEFRAAQTIRRKIYQACLIPVDTMGARHADYVTGVSEATRKRVPEVNEIIPNGVDLRLFTPGSTDEKEKAPTLLFVGTRLGRKRGQWLGDLWTNEIKPKLPEGAVLWTVADEPIEGAGIVNHGRVSVEVLSTLFRRAWAFCLPSLYEGFGVPYIEALASGTPVMASPNVGAIEVLGNGAYGVVAPDDKLAGEIVSVLTDDKRRESLRVAGLARAREYDWQEVAARYEAIYYKLLKLPMDEAVIK